MVINILYIIGLLYELIIFSYNIDGCDDDIQEIRDKVEILEAALDKATEDKEKLIHDNAQLQKGC